MTLGIGDGRRRAGILLHPTSLPSPDGIGSLGKEAYHFIDFLHNSGITLWQTLPVGPTHGDGSPYQCLSVHAGNELLISLEGLVDQGWLLPEQMEANQRASAAGFRYACLNDAYQGFASRASDHVKEEFARFIASHAHWLDDFALYKAIRETHHFCSWVDFPAPLRDRDPRAMKQAAEVLSKKVERAQFEQYVFFQQWHALKAYADKRGVLLFGDMPIFVAHDSAEVWGHREYFSLDEEGDTSVIAGVPPDYFSETGQRWGNPLYRWEKMAEDGYHWWIQRLETQLQLYDVIRIDHFRGFEAYWEIPSDEETAINGRWVKGPGAALFEAIKKAFGSIPLVAEDLGLITEEVHALREQFGLPGMKILQFAFDGGAENSYLPHNHEECSVVYTGTHDNDTSRGWYDSLNKHQQTHIKDYLGKPKESMPWPLVRTAFASVARWAIVPMQDVLELGSEHRMNTPGTSEGNWQWSFQWDQVPEGLAAHLHHLVRIYGR